MDVRQPQEVVSRSTQRRARAPGTWRLPPWLEPATHAAGEAGADGAEAPQVQPAGLAQYCIAIRQHLAGIGACQQEFCTPFSKYCPLLGLAALSCSRGSMVRSLRSAETACAQVGPDEPSSDGVLRRSPIRRFQDSDANNRQGDDPDEEEAALQLAAAGTRLVNL